MNKALPLLLLLASCNRTNQWVLQSYDKDKGYTFVQNGVSYRARCFAIGYVWLSDGVPDANPDSMPSRLAQDQRECMDILPYLNRPIPKFREVNSMLVFTEQGKYALDSKPQDYKLEFEIEEAK